MVAAAESIVPGSSGGGGGCAIGPGRRDRSGPTGAAGPSDLHAGPYRARVRKPLAELRREPLLASVRQAGASSADHTEASYAVVARPACSALSSSRVPGPGGGPSSKGMVLAHSGHEGQRGECEPGENGDRSPRPAPEGQTRSAIRWPRANGSRLLEAPATPRRTARGANLRGHTVRDDVPRRRLRAAYERGRRLPFAPAPSNAGGRARRSSSGCHGERAEVASVARRGSSTSGRPAWTLRTRPRPTRRPGSWRNPRVKCPLRGDWAWPGSQLRGRGPGRSHGGERFPMMDSLPDRRRGRLPFVIGLY